MNRSITKSQIVEYWRNIVDEEDIGVNKEDMHNMCWRCAYKKKLERCHIIPASLGGVDEPFNYVLLCSKCHQEAPNVNDPSFIWEWIKSSAPVMYNSFWTLRAFDEYEKIFHRKPFINMENIDCHGISFKESMENAGIHFGQGTFNTSTLVYIIRDIEKKLQKDVDLLTIT